MVTWFPFHIEGNARKQKDFNVSREASWNYFIIIIIFWVMNAMKV